MEGVRLFFEMDGVEVSSGGEDEPVDLTGFTQQIVRDIENRMIYVRYPNPITLTGKSYGIVRERIRNEGFDSSIDVKVFKECNGEKVLETRGVLKFTDLIEELPECRYQGNVIGKGWGDTLLNNIKIRVFADSNLSKNGVNIGAPSSFPLEPFQPSNGANLPAQTFDAYDVFDYINHQVRFMSDGEVNVVSQFYSNLADDERYAVARGVNMRLQTGEPPDGNFEQIFLSFCKVYNLWGVIETTSTSITLRMEPESFFFNATPQINLTELDNVDRTAFIDQLYSKISFGGFKTDETGVNTTLTFPNPTFVGFNAEEFHIQGQNNVDAELDLLLDVIIDTNLIETTVLNQTDEYDNDLFFIQYNRNTNKATRGNIQLTPAGQPRQYNPLLANNQQIARYNLQGNVAKFFGTQGDRFRASLSGSKSFTNLTNYFEFGHYTDTATPPNNNPNGNFAITNPAFAPFFGLPASTYTCPFPGAYTFFQSVALRLTLSAAAPPTAIALVRFLRLTMLRFDNVGTLLETRQSQLVTNQVFQYNPAPNGTYDFNQTESIFLNQNDQVFFILDALIDDQNIPGGQAADLTIVDTDQISYCEALSTSTSGGIYDDKDIAQFRIGKYTFQRDISDEERRAAISNPANAILFDTDGSVKRRGWPNAVTFNIFDGATDFELISDTEEV